MNSDLFICSHAVDRSLLAQGFTLPGAMLVDFTSWFGALSPGDSRDITIRLDGASHAVRLGNRNFDRVKWPDHGEMYQMRYNPTGTFAKALQTKFSATQKFITDELARRPDLGKKHIKIPAAQREQIVFYRTEDPSVWDAKAYLTNDTFLREYVDGVYVFEDQSADSRSPSEIYLPRAGSSDIYIGLFGSSYGNVASTDGVSPTEKEYEAATAAHAVQWIFLFDGKGPMDLRMRRLRERAGCEHTWKRISSVPELQREVFASFVDLLREKRILANVPYDASVAVDETMFLTRYIERSGSGFGMMVQACREMHLNVPTCEVRNRFFITTIPRKTVMSATPSNTASPKEASRATLQRPQSWPQSWPQSMDNKILSLLFFGEMSRLEICAKVGVTPKTNSLRLSLARLMEDGLIVYTIPKVPKSRLQKYRLTQHGRAILGKLP